MDMLSELAHGITPYRYGFNNPVIWQDATGLFESYNAARYYQLSHGMYGSMVVYNAEHDSWEIKLDEKTITQIGDQILTFYEMDGEFVMEFSKGGGSNNGHDYQKPNSEGKGKDPLYNPFGVVLTTDEGQESPVTQSQGPRDATIVNMNLLWYWATLLYGPDTKAPYELNYKKKKKNKSDVKQHFKYESFITATPITKFRPVKVEKDTFMYGYDYYNTDWSNKKIIDSIIAVEEAKYKNEQYNLN